MVAQKGIDSVDIELFTGLACLGGALITHPAGQRLVGILKSGEYRAMLRKLGLSSHWVVRTLENNMEFFEAASS